MTQSEWFEIEGAHCMISLHCDRGNWYAVLDSRPPLHIDWADGWPRYYFDLERAKREIEAWLFKRGEFVTGTSKWTVASLEEPTALPASAPPPAAPVTHSDGTATSP